MRYKEDMVCLYHKLKWCKTRVKLYEQRLAQAEFVADALSAQVSLAGAKSDVSATRLEISQLKALEMSLVEGECCGPTADPAL